VSIKVLDELVSTKIAAGEVIERPVSVVKELIENALDANATTLEIEIEKGGFELIRVTDDGNGIANGELDLALTRHATSKIVSVEDLEDINSFGFRGEALASISSISNIILVSREPHATRASYIVAHSGELIESGYQGSKIGTSISVENLFQNVPARLSFMKSAASEARRCTTLIGQYAIAHPEVSFKLFRDGNMILSTPGDGKFQDVIATVWGIDIAKQMLEIDFVTLGDVTLHGFASPPNLNRGRKDGQVLFVNNRLIESQAISYAIADCYREYMLKGRYPFVFLFLSVKPNQIDVNVHPTKAQVRFRKEQEIFSIVQKSINGILASDVDSSYERPLKQDYQPLSGELIPEQPRLLDNRYVASSSNSAQDPIIVSTSRFESIGQLDTKYIVAKSDDGIYLFDQHATHERIVFENILASRDKGELLVQGLLNPLNVTLDSMQFETLTKHHELLVNYGFNWDDFGGSTIVLRGIPSDLVESEVTNAFMEILGFLSEEELLNPTTESQTELFVDHQERQIVASLACHGSIRAGQKLLISEMDALLDQFERANYPKVCPHGRPTSMYLSTLDLDKKFGRV